MTLHRTPQSYPTDLEVKDIARSYDINRSGFIIPATKDNGPVRTAIVQKLKDDFCHYLLPRKTFNTSVGSYGLKHIAEHFIGEYVSNGEIIVAMIASYHRTRRDNRLNAEFAITARSIKSVAQEADLRNGWDINVAAYIGDDCWGTLQKCLTLPTERERRCYFPLIAKKQYVLMQEHI